MFFPDVLFLQKRKQSQSTSHQAHQHNSPNLRGEYFERGVFKEEQ